MGEEVLKLRKESLTYKEILAELEKKFKKSKAIEGHNLKLYQGDSTRQLDRVMSSSQSQRQNWRM